MSSFDPAYAFMAPHEYRADDPNGGYTNDPDDPGGETKFGLSKAANPDLDIKNLTLDQAKARYQMRYWLPYGYTGLTAQSVASKVFDMTVNLGGRMAVTLLQRACGDAGHPTTADGNCGALTLAAANECSPASLVDALVSRSRSYYMDLVARRPSSEKYLKGWLRRADDRPPETV